MAVATRLLPLSMVRSPDGGSRGLGVGKGKQIAVVSGRTSTSLTKSAEVLMEYIWLFFSNLLPFHLFWGPLSIPLWQPLTLTGVPMKFLMVGVCHTISSAPTLLSFWMSGHLLSGFSALLGSLSNGVS